MSRSARLRLEVRAVVEPRFDRMGNTLRGDAVRRELAELVRIVREQSNRAHAEGAQDRRGDAVVALVVAEAEREVRVDGVEPALLLQRIRADLVRQPDPATFLAQ